MVTQITKSWLNRMRLGTEKFLGLQITELDSKFRNSKWRIQYGGKKYNKFVYSKKIRYSIIFEVADYESELEFQKFEMADPIWRKELQKVG